MPVSSYSADAVINRFPSTRIVFSTHHICQCEQVEVKMKYKSKTYLKLRKLKGGYIKQ